MLAQTIEGFEWISPISTLVGAAGLGGMAWYLVAIAWPRVTREHREDMRLIEDRHAEERSEWRAEAATWRAEVAALRATLDKIRSG